MALELKVPSVGESITEVEIGEWLKKEGETVRKDETLVTLESEKATVELPAPAAGTLGKVLKPKGATATIGEVIATINEGEGESAPSKPAAAQQPAPVPSPAPAPKQSSDAKPPKSETPVPKVVMPSAERVLAQQGISAENLTGTGPGGRVLKEDALRAVDTASQPLSSPAPSEKAPPPANAQGNRPEEIVPMTRLRRTVAERLVQAQQTGALLTTFNEVDMTESMRLRKEFQEAFLLKYGIKLGFMSFFVKAVVEALKTYPTVNAEIRGNDIVYKNYYDIGVAVGGGKGLVVPIIRNAERLSFAQVEVTIGELAKKVKENKIKPDDLQGGTFTISNGGVYGSLLSTPIVNPPQSGILGMHTIQERPVARDGAVVIRPMMYLALTYDHRIVDGREAVSFLKRVRDLVENPSRILLEV